MNEPHTVSEPMSEYDYYRALQAAQAEAATLRDKAIRFDLDQAGIESREREAVELVDLRAKLAAAQEVINKVAHERGPTCTIYALNRISNERDILRAELTNIVNAKRFDRSVFTDDTEFADWAQNRARHTLEPST